MGKKGTATSGKAQNKTTEEDVTNNGITGVLATDLVELLERQGLPPVEIKKLHNNEKVTESHGTPGEDNCQQVWSSQFPVFVDYENADDLSTLKSFHIRNWLLSERVLSAVTEALAGCSHLSSISLWNVGLTEHTLEQLTQLIIDHNIKQVILDGNGIFSATVLDLLGPKSSVEHLSMKCCGISDSFLTEMALPLSDNKCLVHLNMSCNRIGNDGANSIATSLRLNRTLLSLALTNNHIGDVGALSLAKVLSRFELNHSEIVLRRRLLSLLDRSEDGISLADLEKPKEVGARRSPSVSSMDTKGKAMTIKEKTQQSKGVSKKVETKKEERGKRDEKVKKDSKKTKGKDSKASKKGADPPIESPKLESVETINPLLDVRVEKEQDKLFIPGNTTLVYLTLAFNRIGEDGVHAFLEAMKVQETYSQFGCGILKLSLHHNVPSDKIPDMIEINELLAMKDPLQSSREIQQCD